MPAYGADPPLAGFRPLPLDASSLLLLALAFGAAPKLASGKPDGRTIGGLPLWAGLVSVLTDMRWPERMNMRHRDTCVRLRFVCYRY